MSSIAFVVVNNCNLTDMMVYITHYDDRISVDGLEKYRIFSIRKIHDTASIKYKQWTSLFITRLHRQPSVSNAHC
jgi:hypothetical protein